MSKGMASDDDGNQFVLNEGDIWVEIQKPYKIPFRSILPQGSDCNNDCSCLLVRFACCIQFDPIGVSFHDTGASSCYLAGLAVEEFSLQTFLIKS